jgi:hypothetical protein
VEVIWQREAGDLAQTAYRLIVNEDGQIMFQLRSLDQPQWTDVDELDNFSWKSFAI